MPDQEWVDQFKRTLADRGLSIREVVLATPGLRNGHYPQVLRYMGGSAGLGKAKRDALMETARTKPIRPPTP